MGGDFAEFLGQLPPALILTFCGFMTLMLVALALLVVSMSRKRDTTKRRRRAPAPPVQSAVATASADLPDLDLLLGGLPDTATSDGHTRNRPVAPVQPAPAPKPHAPSSEPERAAPAPKPSMSPPSRSAAAASSPAPAGQWDLPKFSDFSSEPLKLRGGRPKTPVPEIDLAGAIEAYLQHKIRSTAEFAGRSLHVLAAPGGGVQIEVDGHFYEAVGEIEDAPTRRFIAQAIEEWQARQ